MRTYSRIIDVAFSSEFVESRRRGIYSVTAALIRPDTSPQSLRNYDLTVSIPAIYANISFRHDGLPPLSLNT